MADQQVSIWIRAKDAFSGAFRSAERAIKSISKVAKDVGRDLLAIGAGTAAVVLGVTKIAQRGADYIGVQRAFNRITGDGAGALKKLQAATGGVVDNFTMMSKLNTQVSRGAVRSVQEFADLSRAATTLSDVIGVDDTEAFEMLADAIGKGQAKGLQAVGIMIDQEKAAADYAKAIGKSAKDLSELDKKEANRRAGMKEAVRLATELSGGELGAADSGNRLATTITNIKDALTQMVALSPRVADFFQTLEGGLFELSGGDVAERAIEQSLEGLSLRALQGRFRQVDAERLRKEGERSLIEARPERTAHGLINEGRRRDLDAINKQLFEIGREADIVARKLSEVAAGPQKLAVGAAGEDAADTVFRGGHWEATPGNAIALLDRLAAARVAAEDAARDLSISPSEKTQKALDEALLTLSQIAAKITEIGGLSRAKWMAEGMTMISGTSYEDLAKRELSGRTMSGVRAMRERMTLGVTSETDGIGGKPTIAQYSERFMGAELRRVAAAKQEEIAAAKELADTAPLVVSSFGAMAQAAIENSEITASSVIGMLTNIAQSLPGVGQLAGSIIGTVGGIFGGLFHRREKTPVHIDSVSPLAAKQMADAATARPLQIYATFVTPDGRTIEETESVLLNRETRDAVRRPVGVIR